ncbi:MAG: PIG-L family deacetylase [Ardenticatenaceae bacterium]
MAIFAHPDDEGAISGTLAHYARHDTEVTLVCATKGEVGEISDPALATRETLGEVRAAELEAACEVLGIGELRFLGYRDSGMEGTPENEDPRALVQADTDEITGQLVALMRDLQPDVVITFEPFGWYGHPDHQAVSRWATSAYTLVSDPSAYPEMGHAWQPQSLFHAVIRFSNFQSVIQEAKEGGFIEEEGFGIELPLEKLLEIEAQVTHVLDVRAQFDTKRRATTAHRTQFREDHIFLKIPKEIMIKSSGYEHFIQVYPAPSPVGELRETPQTDLFADG